jgi:hypothetical protein
MWMAVGGRNHSMMPPPGNQQMQGLPSPATGFRGILGKTTAEFKNGYYPFHQECVQPKAATSWLGISPLYMRKPQYGTAPSMPASGPKKRQATKTGGQSSNIVIDEF